MNQFMVSPCIVILYAVLCYGSPTRNKDQATFVGRKIRSVVDARDMLLKALRQLEIKEHQEPIYEKAQDKFENKRFSLGRREGRRENVEDVNDDGEWADVDTGDLDGGLDVGFGHVPLLPFPVHQRREAKEKEDPCTSQPCQNGGRCVSAEDPYGYGYYCHCDDPTGGIFCQHVNACKENPCPEPLICRRSFTDQQYDEKGRYCHDKDWNLYDV